MRKNYSLQFSYKTFNGAIETRDFLDKVFKETIKAIKKYYDCQPDSYKEYGFEFGEEQVKTFLTVALNNVTKGNFIQEYPLNRKYREHDNSDFFSANGYLDYWASFSKCDYLLEIKHGWIRYYIDSGEYTIYQKTIDKFQSSISQLDSIEYKTDLKINNHLFGIGLIVAPIYVRNKKPDTLNDPDSFNDFLFEEVKKLGGDFIGIWHLESEYLQEFTYETDSGTYKEYYPTLLFFGKIKKYSRK